MGVQKMKIKKSLLIIAMILISLLAIGAVSASDDATDIVANADDMEIVESDIDVDEIAVNEDVNVLTDGEEGSGCSTDTSGCSTDTSGCSTDTGGQGQGGGGLGDFDIGSLLNGTGRNSSNGNGSGFDFGDLGGIGDLFGGLFGGSSDTLKCNNLNVYYAKKTTYSVKLVDSKGNPLAGKVVSFAINNKIVGATTNSKGVAKLKVKLKPGNYVVTAQFGDTTVLSQIKVKNNIITKDVTKKYKKKGKFKIKVVNPKGKPLKKQILKIKFNKQIYKLKTNKKGKAIFKLSKSLKKGKYTIKIKCNGLSKKNKITVK
jgi:hypothetical protein